ncbi:pentapeptide repeat-containing protein [Pontibacter sp. BAB1700]|nr:pentapeptide repeat-containing protein [Pontibacter sp. BAB1700]
MVDANFEGCDLSKANLKGSEMRYTKILMSSFIEANLTGADLSGCSMAYSDFSHAIMDEVNFSGADINLIENEDDEMDKNEFAFTSMYGAIITSPEVKAFLIKEGAELQV